ncbi:enterobactin transporter EntS [Serratia ficaria]|uniref:enterobactin transporter EntS n=1 Tax=Serratia ficaria TaxID=61651 RepID=UPI0021827777|nr:enterobactin transporter EntS [Serratia ficaria]CAI2398973.1 enterobactin exporter EntS [Serratia ficaria]
MAKPSIFVNFGLLKRNENFRAIFIARLLSVLALGMLAVGVPVQIQAMTGSTLQVGIAVALDGAGMFVGLLLGGVLADRLDRRRLILFARTTCGLGFAALSYNAFLAAPSLAALYILAVWDGFFGALGMTALMAAIPALVGRENLATAGALSMLTVRLGAIVSPAVGGVVIVAYGVEWNYAIAAIGTLITLIPLFSLPGMRPEPQEPEHPLRSLATGIHFVFSHKIVCSVVIVGALISVISAVRVLFPALAETAYHAGPAAIGLMYSAVPLGAMIGAFTSGWVTHVARPGMLLLGCAIGAFLAIAALGVVGWLPLALIALACYGYLSAMASLLQYTLVQSHTPDRLLGRVNSVWTTQDVTGDSIGALGLGVLGRMLTPALSVLAFGGVAALCGVGIALCVGPLRKAVMGAPSLHEEPEPAETPQATSS